MTPAPLVSIVIPCFDQGRFLGDAIASALAQTHRPLEVIVVDDGSRDESAAVAERHAGVRVVRQTNQGLAAARNAGWRSAAGDYVVFLDADDWLRPDALAQNLACFARHPEAAFVWGHHERVDGARRPLPTDPPAGIRSDHYRHLLRGNCVGMCATVLYRRSVLEHSGGFDPTLPACEDYDLYLRVASRWAVQSHDAVLADYRQHAGNMSRDPEFMLTWVQRVLERQRDFVQGRPELEGALRDGLAIWHEYYWGFLVDWARVGPSTAGAREAFRRGGVVLRAHPTRWRLRRGKERAASALAALRRRARQRFPRPPVGRVDLGNLRAASPLGAIAPSDARGVERCYANAFVARHAGDLRGSVLVVGDAEVARLAPPDAVVASFGRLATFEPERFDCVLVAAGLECVPDLDVAMRALRRVLRTGGVLLLALPGTRARRLAPAQERRFFTPLSAQRLLEEAFGAGAVEVESHGNVLAASASLQGVPADALRASELRHVDPRHPVLVGARALKPPRLRSDSDEPSAQA